MTEIQCLQFAEKYLLSRGIPYAPNGEVGRKENGRWEIIFPVLESLDPNIAVVDPPDVRVWVSTTDGVVELIHQM